MTKNLFFISAREKLIFVHFEIKIPFFSRGKRRAQRWYSTVDTMKKEIVGRDLYGGFDANIASEWESWLRHRRSDAPTAEEVKIYFPSLSSDYFLSLSL